MSPRDESLRLIVNEVLPQRLRRALAREARRRDVSPSEMGVILLAEHFGLKYIPRTKYRVAAERVQFHVTPEIHQKIRREAARVDGTVRGVAIDLVSRALGLGQRDPGRRPRRKVGG